MKEHEDFKILQKMLARHGDTDIALWLADIAGRNNKPEIQESWMMTRNRILMLRRRGGDNPDKLARDLAKARADIRRQDKKIDVDIKEREAQHWRDLRARLSGERTAASSRAEITSSKA